MTNLSIDCLAINASSPSIVYAGTVGGGVFRSTDGGASWVGSNTGITSLFVDALAIDPSTPATIYAGTNSGLFKSTDSGVTWWAAPGTAGLGVYAILIDRSAPSTVFAGTFGGGVYRSTDAGATWVAGETDTTGLVVSALAIDRTVPAKLLAGTWGGIVTSIDSGTTWAASNAGLSAVSVSALVADPRNLSTVYAGTWGNSIFKSTDAGRTWVAASTGLGGFSLISDGLSISALALDPADSSTLYAGTSKNNGSLFKSTDGGGTWEAANTGLTDVDVFALAIDPSTPSIVYAGTVFNGVFRSSDAGASWVSTNAGLTTLNVVTLAIDPDTPSIVYAGTTSGVFKSTDSGGTWAGVGGGWALAIDPKTPSTLYSGTNAGVLKSTDSGTSWTPASTGLANPAANTLVEALAIDRTNPSTLYAGTTNGVFKSTDSGSTWFSIDHGLPAVEWAPGLPATPSVRQMSLDATGRTLYVALYTPGVWQLTPSGIVTVPIVLSASGLNGSFFTSELTLTNRGRSDDAITYTYTAAFGGGSGSASDTLAAGTQRVIPDAIEYLKSLGIPVGETGHRGGTLRIEFSGLGAATVRTTTSVPGGRAGLAYAGLPPSRLLSTPVYVCGLRQNAMDRSNVAVVNAGAASDGPITLRLTIFSGDPANPADKVLPGITLPPGGFSQVDDILQSTGLSLTNGYVKVERVSGTAPFTAYGVINDQANSDGSFVEPVTPRQAFSITRLTLPIVVESGDYSSELVLTNFSPAARTLRATWVARALTKGRVSFDLQLLPSEQHILPAFVQVLRSRGVVTDPAGSSLEGALFITDATGDLRGVSVGARTLAPGGGGRYGAFCSAVPAGSEASTFAWLYGLRQDAENRTNVALVNIGEEGWDATFRIDLFDAVTGRKAGTADGIRVPAMGFRQIDSILRQFAPGVSSAYALVTNTASVQPFIAYAVINDGEEPGQRSGDGAIVEADTMGQ